MVDKGEDRANEGRMDAHTYYQAEFGVTNEAPKNIQPGVKGIEARLNGEQILLSRLNTKVCVFSPMTVTVYGVEIDVEYVGFDRIHVSRGENLLPCSYIRPEEAGEAQAEWDTLAERLINIDCDYVRGFPKMADFEYAYRVRRGEEPIDNILERILQDAWD